MAAPPAESVEFGPRRGPIWVARIFGAIACMGAVLVLAIAATVGRQTPGMIAFLGVFGLVWAAFGAWMLFAASRMARFRAVLTPSALRVTASRGRSIWFQGDVAEVTVSWPDVQGFDRVDTLNPSAQSGTQSTYILLTKAGDFSLNNVQWENLDGLIREVVRRTGHGAGQVASERAAAQAEIQAKERRMSSAQRVFGWIVLVTSGLMLLAVMVGTLATGFSSDLLKAALFLVFAMSVGASVIRFYRRR
jgi:hypothetical protein